MPNMPNPDNHHPPEQYRNAKGYLKLRERKKYQGVYLQKA
jgi:hypothetical protein